MARAFLAVSTLDLPRFARARIAVIDPEVLDFLKLISPMSRPPIPGHAAWLVGWRSETLRGLRNGESNHPVFIPQIAGVDMDFGWHDALARWAVTERASTWLPRFTLQARAIIRAVCAEPARFLVCEKCGRP
jgi:hypothetical protein